MAIIDTHTHLSDPVFDKDRSDVIERAVQAGVTAIITVSETLKDARRNLQLSAEHAALRPAAGLYPTHLDASDADAMIDFIRKNRDNVVAIGEVGLDFWAVQEHEARQQQRDVFARFIELSKELDLPLNVHSRSAGRHVVAMLLEHDARRVHLHAFDGKASSALPAVEAGYCFSIPPSILRSNQKQILVKRLPLSCLLIETDSPVLGPSPKTRNEPANASIVVDAIAEIKGIAKEDVLETIYRNTLRLYKNILKIQDPTIDKK